MRVPHLTAEFEEKVEGDTGKEKKKKGGITYYTTSDKDEAPFRHIGGHRSAVGGLHSPKKKKKK